MILLKEFLNGAGRFFYNTSDLIWDGHQGRGWAFEAGLFPTARAKKWQERLVTGMETVLPETVFEALDFIEEHKEAARKKPAASRSPMLKR